MANKHATLSDLFTAIADAIRAKTDDTAAITADDFPTAIQTIVPASALARGTITTITDNTVTSIRRYLFESCSKLTSVQAKACTTVGQGAFSHCSSLQSVDLLGGYIAYDAFSVCRSLDTLILRSTSGVCRLADSTVFLGCQIAAGGTGYVYVPRALLASYQTAANWNTFYYEDLDTGEMVSQFRAIEDYPAICGGTA